MELLQVLATKKWCNINYSNTNKHIVGYLSCEDISSVESVSRKTRETCDEGFWKSLLVRDFHIRFCRGSSALRYSSPSCSRL